MRARLVVDASLEELAAACGENGGTLDLSVVEVEASDGSAGRVDGITPLARIVSDPPGGPGPAVRIFMRTLDTTED